MGVEPAGLTSHDGDELPVELNTDFFSVVVVDGLPSVPAAKVPRLTNVIRKHFEKYGPIREGGMFMPMDESSINAEAQAKATPENPAGKTCGYCFIEFESRESAAEAVLRVDNTPLDKQHTFRVNLFDDFEKFDAYPLEYNEPDKREFEDNENLNSWLLDENCRDQFALRFGDETVVYWNDPLQPNQGRAVCYAGDKQKESGKQWTELYIQWSSLGSYLATFHHQGIMLWGGEGFQNLGRFGHNGVKAITFSPMERYIVTFNGMEVTSKGDSDCIVVWDVRSGTKLRGFPPDSSHSGKKGWPIFKWSHDDKYLARLVEDSISVYEAPSMKLLDRKSINIPGVKDFEWSPSDHVISYWIPEKEDIPASVSLIEIPSRKPLREKHLFNVYDVKLHWQKTGDYLCVKVARQKSKSKAKVTSTNFEIFRLREKDVPVEVLEVTESILAFAWEPVGVRFAYIFGDGPSYSINFYSLKKNKLKKELTLENRSANALFWSPIGNHIVIANLGSGGGGELEFYDVNRKLSNESEHYLVSDVEWDPAGRYVATAVTQPLVARESWKYSMDNGYKMFTFQGHIKANVPLESLYQFQWRPRPPTLLSTNQIKDIRNGLRENYYKKFDEEDEQLRISLITGDAKLRADAWKQYREYRAQCDEEYRERAALRQQLRNGIPSDDENDYEIVEQEVEEEVYFHEEVIEQV